MMDHVSQWTNAVVGAFSTALGVLLSFLPNLLGFLLILILGWIIASLIASAVGALLRRVKFNDLAAKAGISKFVESTGARADASGMVAFVVKWIVRIIALVAAFNALQLPAVSQLLTDLLNWMPNLLVAMVILVVGGWAAAAVSGLVRGAAATAEADNTNMVANIAKTAVWILTFIVAFNQLGIGSELVQILFTAIVGALAIGLGLAVGLGGKDLAAEVLRDWYNNNKKG